MGAFLSGCGAKSSAEKSKSESKKEPVVQVHVATVVDRAMPQYLILTGTLSAERESDVAANASGQVTATFVERGQEVKKGQMLATLDARLLSLSEQAAAAQSELAKSQASLAEFECERGKRLFEDHAIS